MDTVSVIIPVFNAEKYLDECLRSVLSQTYKALEVILIDDGSLDGSGSLCDRWAETDSRVRVIHQANLGVSAARNAGIDKASGEWLLFVDSDDLLHHQAVEVLTDCQKSLSSDYVIALHKMTSEEGSSEWSIPVNQADKLFAVPIAAPAFFSLREEKGFVTGHLIRKDLTDNIRFSEDIDLGEDAAFNYQLFFKGEVSISLTETVLYYYRYRNTSAAAQGRGFEGYYLTAKWYSGHIDECQPKYRSLILKESMKKCLLYRYELGRKNGRYISENRVLIKRLLCLMWKDSQIPAGEKTAYLILSAFPFAYRLYTLISLRR